MGVFQLTEASSLALRMVAALEDKMSPAQEAYDTFVEATRMQLGEAERTEENLSSIRPNYSPSSD